MNAVKVLLIEDLPIHTDFKPKPDEEFNIPTKTSNYDLKFLPEGFLRNDLKPLQVIQPEGPSFTVDGNEIQWQLWNFRIRYGSLELNKLRALQLCFILSFKKMQFQLSRRSCSAQRVIQ